MKGDAPNLKAEITKSIPGDQKTCYINVDSYDNKQLTGTVYNPFYKCSKPYSSLTELLFLMEQLFDELFIPKTKNDIRSFRKTNIKPSTWADDPRLTVETSGELATFKVDVLFRQRASWQGIICWMDESVEECFRSTLEMIELMDSALVPEPEISIKKVAKAKDKA